MDQQLACPHCRKVVAVAPAATARQAQCPYCQGMFMAPAVNTDSPQPSQNATSSAARRGTAAPSARKSNPSAQAYLKYLAAAVLLIGMTVVPVVGFVVVRWLSPPADAAHVAADAGPAKAAEGGVAISGTVVMNEPVAPPPGASANGSNQPQAALSNDKMPGAATGIAQASSVPAKPAPSAATTVAAAPRGGTASPIMPVSAEVAQPASTGDTTALVQRVEPSVVVVQVTLEKGSGIGSGFALDDKGTIVTNYHVIEGAKSAKIKFGQKTVDVEGFLVFSPGKDIAILKAKLGAEKIAPLTLATRTPSKGETVLTFGAPQGFESTVSNGIVSSVRKGTDLQEIFKQVTGEDVYVNHQHYDLDATWVQTTAPISGGNSGGPLVNLRGEVVGLNTWVFTRGQNMNFAISANHINEIMRSANSGVHPLTELPAPREHEAVAGSTSRTLEYWEQVSKINRVLANRLKTVRQPPIPTGKVTKAQVMALFPKLAGTYKKLADMLPEAAAKLKALKIDDVDSDLVALVTVDALVLEKIGQEARELSADAKNFTLEKVVLVNSEKLGKKAYGEYEKLEIGQAYDVMRIRLTNRYGETFASIFDASARPKSGSQAADEDDASDGDGKTADAGDAKREKNATGRLKIAKNLKDAGKRDAAKERLQKIVEEFPGTKAAEEAQQLLDELAAP